MGELGQTELVKIEPLLQMAAYKPFWDAFVSTIDPDEKSSPTLEVRAGWFREALLSWAWNARFVVKVIGESFERDKLERGASESLYSESLGLMLESILHAANTALKFKHMGLPIDIPANFLATSNRICAAAEEENVCGEDSSISKIALRLAAATSHQYKGPRRTTVNEKGHVLDSDGMRLFQFEPKKILKARRDAKEGKIYSLDAIDEVDERNGR